MRILHQKHSKNHDLRPTQDGHSIIKYLIIHYTEMNFDDALSKLCDSTANVSAHYIIKKSGQIYQLVGDFYRAWHCGLSCWKKDYAINDSSIGIELDNLGTEEFQLEQINSLLELLKLLQNKYNIARENILGHSDISPERKIDPGLYFDWNLLKRYGFGIPFCQNNKLSNMLRLNAREISSIQTKLKNVGYNIGITGILDKQTSDVFRAFKLHFNKEAIFQIEEKQFLANLENIYQWDDQSDRILNMLNELK